MKIKQKSSSHLLWTVLLLCIIIAPSNAFQQQHSSVTTDVKKTSSPLLSLSAATNSRHDDGHDDSTETTQDKIVPSSIGAGGGVYFDRRTMIKSAGVTAAATGAAAFLGTTATTIFPSSVAYAAESTTTTTTTGGGIPISASWSAVDGLNSLNKENQIVSFDENAYKAMRDDSSRTPLFKDAIIQRLGQNPQDNVVLDLGTGPFALFAIIAAEAGAKKVYAIEGNAASAESARNYVKKAGYDDIITIIEGFSTNVQLPEKVDFVIAEIVGSIASEEGAYATIYDASTRFVKNPNLASSWIPCRIQTYAAPASYTLHNLLGPPEFDWMKLNGEPIRFNCRDRGLCLLANPVLIEDINFATIQSKKEQDTLLKGSKSYTFIVDESRVEDNYDILYNEFRRDKRNSVNDSERLAKETSTSFSGIAMWPRLILYQDDDNNNNNNNSSIVVNSRQYGTGDYQKSHWQSVMPIMSSRPIPITGGTKISITTTFHLPLDVTKPPNYTIRGVVG